LAVNIEWPLVSISTSEVENKEKTAEDLSFILEMDKSEVLKKLESKDSYLILKKKISQEQVSEIKALNLKGVLLQKEMGRYYPYEELASQLVGFLNGEGLGQYGLEEYYDDTLRGDKEKGDDLYLTIDYSVQFMAEKILKEAGEALDMEAGEIVVMDPNTGEIIALANYPSFNPNSYSAVSDLSVFQNAAAQGRFEPGSIFKPFTMAMALDMGVITPSTTYRDPGTMQIGGWPIYNYERRTYPGDITMTKVLEKSINTGAVFAQQKVGNQNFLDYFEEFGFCQASGIDLPETYSENKELKKGYEINFATASFGQGVEVTSLQVVKALSAIANGGNLMDPYVVSKIGEKEIEPKILEAGVVSDKAASQLASMLVGVVEEGYGKPARIPGYYIGGKTGTAQIAWTSLGISKSGYSEKTWQSFLGLVPALNPEFVVLVKMKNPETKTAEYSAVPAFKEMVKYLLDFYQIPPDYTE
jgi:cell division protein FtsI/penicillin-binding protein 2